MKHASALMRRRAGLAEHPFGTLKCRAGYRHFLVRGFDKVRGEWGLMVLCYNFTRVVNIIGFDRFIAAMAKIAAIAFLSPISAAQLLIRRTTRSLQRLGSRIAQNNPRAKLAIVQTRNQ